MRWFWGLRQRARFLVATGTTLTLLMSGLVLFQAPLALAVQANCSNGPYIDYGRYEFCGYFGNHYEASGDRLWNGGVPANVNSAATFIAFVEAEKNIPGQQQTSAEFVIDTMEGLTPTSNPSNSRGEAWTLAADWEHRINGGLADGTLKINFFQNVSWACGQEDTFYQPTWNDVAGYITSAATQETPPCGPGVTVPAIVFSDAHTGKVLYVIKRSCGNPIGKLNPLPEPAPPPYALKVTLTPGAGTPPYTTGPGTGIVEPGKTYHLTPAVTNPSANNAAALNMNVENLTPVLIANGGISGTGGQVSWNGYMAGNCASGVSPCWAWEYNSGLTKNSTSVNTDGVTFTVSANAAQGSTVCFKGWISPSTQVAGSVLTTAKDCFLVYTPIIPSVVGNNGDVHAGGGLCDAAGVNGYVQGYPTSGSGGEYIVSATGAINGFGSDASPTSGTELNEGRDGAYSEVCREDLLSAANMYRADGGALVNPALPGNTYSISNWSGLYYIDGPATLSGTVNHKVTIVVNGGNVTIAAPGITLNAATSFPVKLVPSLGIISSGDIDINNNVLRVDAYLFADGNINTCVQANASCATAPLVVDGFLMAKNVAFERLGISTAKGATAGEIVNLNPELYLNPPQFFDSSVDDVLLQGQGQSDPLF